MSASLIEFFHSLAQLAASSAAVDAQEETKRKDAENAAVVAKIQEMLSKSPQRMASLDSPVNSIPPVGGGIGMSA